MATARTLLPIAGPLLFALGLGVVVSLSDDAEPSDAGAVVYPEHPPGPARPALATPRAEPPATPIDRPRCLARMTLDDLSRQLMTTRQAEAIAELYRDHAPPEVARAYHHALADAAAALAPGVARSRLLAIAADGLARLGAPEPALAAIEASREIPAPQANEFGFDRSAWRGQAASVAARLDDHALAERLIADDTEARAALARHYAEQGEASRARTFLAPAAAAEPSAEPERFGSLLGWRLAQASALAALGELDDALALADESALDAPLVRVELARTLLRQSQPERAAVILREAAESIPAAATEPRPSAGPDDFAWTRHLAVLAAIARALHDAGEPERAAELRTRIRADLRARGDHFQTLSLWPALIEATHRAGQAAQAWDDLTALDRITLSSMGAGPTTRVLLLTEEGRMTEALQVIHETAGMPYPLVYAQVHARLRGPDPGVEAGLDRGLRLFCP